VTEAAEAAAGNEGLAGASKVPDTIVGAMEAMEAVEAAAAAMAVAAAVEAADAAEGGGTGIRSTARSRASVIYVL
jgi:hypothetical protein